MKTLHKLATAALVVGLFPLTAGKVEAQTFIVPIDPLTDTQQAAIIPPFANTPTSMEDITSFLLGSVTRTITIEQQSASQTGDSLVASIPRGSQAGLSFSSGDFTDGKVTLDYGTFAPVDFTADGSSEQILIGLISSDLPDAVITVTLNGFSESITVAPESADPPPRILALSLSDFDAGLDPTSVTSFSIMLDPVTAGDLSIDSLLIFGSVPPPPPGTPEPTTMLGLMAVAGFGASALKRKQR